MRIHLMIKQKMTFKHFSKLFIDLNEDIWKPSYLSKQKGIVDNRFNMFNDKDIRDIKVTDCKLWYKSLDDVGSKSKRHYVSVLKGIFDIAYYDDVIQRNPALHVKQETYTAPKINPFTADQVQQIIEKANFYNFNFVYFLAMGFYTGMRTGEILALKKNEVDFNRKTIHINSTRSRHGEGATKTAKSKRVIPILDLLLPYLEEMYNRNTTNYMLVTQYQKPYRDSFVFTQRWWTPILKELNLEYRRPYNMRHTYATNMLYKDLVTPVQLAQLLGHSSTKMIYEVYVQYLNSNFDDFDRSISVYN